MLKLDEYSLEKFLGKGTFGEVYFTRKMNSPNLYATKRMSKQMVDDPKYNKYFINEISILRKLYHPNIIRIEDLKVTQNHYYIVMEYSTIYNETNYQCCQIYSFSKNNS